MARIAGVDLPRAKRIEIGLTYIYGIGQATSNQILKAVDIDPNKRVKDLDEADVAKLRQYIDKNYQVEGEKRKEVSMNIKRLSEIGSYRGVRHRKGITLRGQRTHSNARTARGMSKKNASKKK